MPRAPILLLLLCVATPLFGYRREYRVTLGDVRKAGSEVCFFRGQSASDAFSLFFSYDRVRCLPAGDVLEFPPGLFHAFARHPDGYASVARDFFVGEDAGAARSYERLDIPLTEAGITDLAAAVATMTRGQSAGIWIGPTETTAGTFLPLVDGETTIITPAGVDFVPLAIAQGRPVAVGDVSRVRAGQTLRVPRFETEKNGYADVVGWLKLDAATAARASVPLRLPRIALTTGEVAMFPVLPLRNPLNATHTLLIFKHVPAGAATIRVDGRTWVPSERALVIGGARVHLETTPVWLSPASALDLSWNEAANASASTADCGTDVTGRPQITAILQSCADTPSARRQQQKCAAVARQSRPFTGSGPMSFDGLPAGDYTVEVELPFRDPVTVPVRLETGVTHTMVVPMQAFEFFGRVTVNGNPVEALLLFESGETRSDSAGMYNARLAADPLTNLITVVTCADGETRKHIVETRIRPNSRYDIAIRTRRLTVLVNDADGAAVANARVSFAPAMDSDAVHYSESRTTAGTGEVTFDVPSDKAVKICAAHDEHLAHCLAAQRFAAGTDARAVVQLGRIGMRGKVIGHAGSAMLVWADRTGRIVEQAEIAADGRFTADGRQQGVEYVVYVSDQRPLTVLPWNTASSSRSSEVVLSLPAAPARSVTVTVPGMIDAMGLIGVWIGGHLIPLEALQRNQEARGLDVLIQRGQPLTLVALAETGPIELAFAPFPRQGSGAVIDPFTIAPYASVQRQRVQGAAVVLVP